MANIAPPTGITPPMTWEDYEKEAGKWDPTSPYYQAPSAPWVSPPAPTGPGPIWNWNEKTGQGTWTPRDGAGPGGGTAPGAPNVPPPGAPIQPPGPAVPGAPSGQGGGYPTGYPGQIITEEGEVLTPRMETVWEDANGNSPNSPNFDWRSAKQVTRAVLDKGGNPIYDRSTSKTKRTTSIDPVDYQRMLNQAESDARNFNLSRYQVMENIRLELIRMGMAEAQAAQQARQAEAELNERRLTREQQGQQFTAGQAQQQGQFVASQAQQQAQFDSQMALALKNFGLDQATATQKATEFRESMDFTRRQWAEQLALMYVQQGMAEAEAKRKAEEFVARLAFDKNTIERQFALEYERLGLTREESAQRAKEFSATMEQNRQQFEANLALSYERLGMEKWTASQNAANAIAQLDLRRKELEQQQTQWTGAQAQQQRQYETTEQRLNREFNESLAFNREQLAATKGEREADRLTQVVMQAMNMWPTLSLAGRAAATDALNAVGLGSFTQYFSRVGLGREVATQAVTAWR